MKWNKITKKVPWNPQKPVHLVLEKDIMDGACIIFFQIIDKQINIINFYEEKEKSLTII